MGTSTNGRRRDIRGEADYLPATIEDLADLHGQLIEAGCRSAVASGICTWVALKAAGQPDPTDSATRSKYRKILAELEAGGPDGPGHGRHLEPVRPAARIADPGEGPESTFDRGSVKYVALDTWRRAA